jgi:hypothetical protein
MGIPSRRRPMGIARYLRVAGALSRFSLFEELFFPSSSFRDSRFPLLPPATHARESLVLASAL